MSNRSDPEYDTGTEPTGPGSTTSVRIRIGSGFNWASGSGSMQAKNCP